MLLLRRDRQAKKSGDLGNVGIEWFMGVVRLIRNRKRWWNAVGCLLNRRRKTVGPRNNKTLDYSRSVRDSLALGVIKTEAASRWFSRVCSFEREEGEVERWAWEGENPRPTHDFPHRQRRLPSLLHPLSSCGRLTKGNIWIFIVSNVQRLGSNSFLVFHQMQRPRASPTATVAFKYKGDDWGD